MVSVQGPECSVTVDANRTAATYAAFCRKYGNYKTTAAGSHNWNEEAIERMVRDLAAPWQSLRSTLQNRHESIIIFVEELIDWAIQYLGTSGEDRAYVIGGCPIGKLEKASAPGC